MKAEMKLRARAQLGDARAHNFDVKVLANMDKVEEKMTIESVQQHEILAFWHQILGHRNYRDIGHVITARLLT